MTTYEAVPNTDGQILIPVGKKPPVVPQRKFSRTVPPPRRPPASGISVRKSGAQARPRSPPIHRPVRRSGIRLEASRTQQSRASNNNLRERLGLRKAAARRWQAVNPPTSSAQALSSHALNHRFTGSRPESVITKDEIPVKIEDQVNADKMSLSYIMGNQLGAHKLRPISERKEKNVIDLSVSFESDEEKSEDEDEDEEMPLVHGNVVHTRYPSFFTDNRSNILNNPNAKYRLANPGITTSLRDSLLNTPRKLEGVEQGRNSEFGESAGTAEIAQFRADRRLPPISASSAAYYQSQKNIKVSSPITPTHPTPTSTKSSNLNTLEHAAVTTLASLNRTSDLNKFNSSTSYRSGLNLNLSSSSNGSPRALSLKRPSSLISTPTPTPKQLPESKLPVSLPITGLEPATKRLRISSLLNPPSSPLISASPTSPTKFTSIFRAETPIRHPDGLTSDSDDDTLTPPPPSSAYPSPPASPSHSLPPPPALLLSTAPVPLRTIPRPLIPRTPLPNIQPPNPSINPQSHILFFNNQVYSPLPSPSSSLPRSSSAPPLPTPTPTSTCTSTSTSPFSPPTPHPRPLTHKNFTYRAWKLRPSRSTLTNPPPSHAQQYLIVIRHDDCSKTTRTQDSSSSNTDTAGNMGKWWSVLNGRKDMEEIRKIFE
ncbi:hypothetical protein OCU04_002477 [Sclerotinia nivalis]|uniref:Uncharacterized protein n=1 Tax=Sclerotinia nivalis TaxID=352851 RepID=A0A9X0ATP5_9HELO|nr:hypothetical protein OCU04_002477 [Sclerotinia nivalis]